MNWEYPREIAGIIQHTNVRPDLTRDELIAHVEQCAEYGFQAAMIPPAWVRLSREVLSGTGVKIATTVNFPQATDTAKMKAAVIPILAREGADEFDFPPNPALLLSGLEQEYFDEIKQVVAVAHAEGLQVKAMLEFGFFESADMRRTAARLADEGGVDWVKQSSGWGRGGIAATPEDVQLLRETVAPRCGVKASGKVNSLDRVKAMVEAGATLIGTSSGVAILQGRSGAKSAY